MAPRVTFSRHLDGAIHCPGWMPPRRHGSFFVMPPQQLPDGLWVEQLLCDTGRVYWRQAPPNLPFAEEEALHENVADNNPAGDAE